MDARPRRRRDTLLYYATVVTLALQVLVAAFPEVCSSFAPQEWMKRILPPDNQLRR